MRSYTLDPYGLVNKAEVWYLVADHRGQPKLFRADRVHGATVLDEPVQRRDGLELAEVWDSLRRQIDDIPTPVAVTVSVGRQILGRSLRVHQADLAGPPPAEPATEPGTKPQRVRVQLQFRSLGAAEALLMFGTDAEVLPTRTPPEPHPQSRPSRGRVRRHRPLNGAATDARRDLPGFTPPNDSAVHREPRGGSSRRAPRCR